VTETVMTLTVELLLQPEIRSTSPKAANNVAFPLNHFMDPFSLVDSPQVPCGFCFLLALLRNSHPASRT
jgi:hypothetical protein